MTSTLTCDFDLWLWLTLFVTLTGDLWLVSCDFDCLVSLFLDLWPLPFDHVLLSWSFVFLFLCLQSWSFVSCCLLSVYLVSLERQSNCLLVWWWVRRTVCLWVSMAECHWVKMIVCHLSLVVCVTCIFYGFFILSMFLSMGPLLWFINPTCIGYELH